MLSIIHSLCSSDVFINYRHSRKYVYLVCTHQNVYVYFYVCALAWRDVLSAYDLFITSVKWPNAKRQSRLPQKPLAWTKTPKKGFTFITFLMVWRANVGWGGAVIICVYELVIFWSAPHERHFNHTAISFMCVRVLCILLSRTRMNRKLGHSGSASAFTSSDFPRMAGVRWCVIFHLHTVERCLHTLDVMWCDVWIIPVHNVQYILILHVII